MSRVKTVTLRHCSIPCGTAVFHAVLQYSMQRCRIFKHFVAYITAISQRIELNFFWLKPQVNVIAVGLRIAKFLKTGSQAIGARFNRFIHEI